MDKKDHKIEKSNSEIIKEISSLKIEKDHASNIFKKMALERQIMDLENQLMENGNIKR